MKTEDATEAAESLSELGTIGSQQMGSSRKQTSAGLNVGPLGARGSISAPLSPTDLDGTAWRGEWPVPAHLGSS